MDGLFGLPRKKGVSHRDAVHGSLFFCDQDHVDQYVPETQELRPVPMVYTGNYQGKSAPPGRGSLSSLITPK